MAEEQNLAEGQGVNDSVSAELNGIHLAGSVELPEDAYDSLGNLKEGYKGPDPEEHGDHEERKRAVYEGWKHDALKEIAEARNIKAGSMKKAELVEALLDDEVRSSAGGLPIGHVDEEAGVKGPGEQWRRDDEGATSDDARTK